MVREEKNICEKNNARGKLPGVSWYVLHACGVGVKIQHRKC